MTHRPITHLSGPFFWLMLFGYRGNSVETDKKGERIELEKMVILNLRVLANSGNKLLFIFRK